MIRGVRLVVSGVIFRGAVGLVGSHKRFAYRGRQDLAGVMEVKRRVRDDLIVVFGCLLMKGLHSSVGSCKTSHHSSSDNGPCLKLYLHIYDRVCGAM